MSESPLSGPEAQAVESWQDRGRALLLRTESPIEAALMHAILGARRKAIGPFSDALDFRPGRFFWATSMLDAPGGIEAATSSYVLWAQAFVLHYRVDFLLLDRRRHERPIWNVIECDGHNFHERTKEQASNDRSRDRDMTHLGLRIYRFTGHEIIADPDGVVTELGTYISMGRY